MKLIDLTESGHFIGLPLFEKGSEKETCYRTVCFKTVELLWEQQKEFEKLKKSLADEKQKNEEMLKPKDTDEAKKIEELERNIQTCEKQIQAIDKYCSSINPDAIEIAIQFLRPIYDRFGKEHYGNISVFVALVYYKLLDNNKFSTFIDWIIKNGINKIPVTDHLPTHNAKSLITLFERIYESKRKEVFISMQFGDPQSEMIYEKIVQTIERFNQEKGLDIKINTIRIDQKISSELFNVSEEISKAIENSSLLIADLSSHNINVYHEIGIAMGLAQAKNIRPQIILLYKTDTVFLDKNNDNVDNFVGFNIRGESQLRFQTNKQLVDGLVERLEKHYDVTQ